MKRILKLIGGLVALIIIAALAAPLFISADFIKTQLTEQVKKATGRDLVIKGKASLSILPNIAVSVEDVTLGNPAGFVGEYFVHMDKLETGAALKPLLAKELRITGVTLVGARINLEETASGAKNWEFAKAEAPAAKADENTSPSADAPLKGFAIGTVTITNAAVNYSKAGAKPVALEAINLSLKGADGASPLALKGDAVLRGEKVDVTLDVKSMKDFMAGKLVPTTLALALPAGKVNFVGQAGAKGAEYGAEGKLDAAISDVAKLQSWASGNKAKPAFPKSVVISSQVKASGVSKTLVLSGLSAQMDALKATGALTIKHGGAVPAIAGELTIPLLDLAAISGAKQGDAGAAGGEAKPAASSSGWSDAPIDASGLRAVNADVKLSIGQLKNDKVIVDNIATDITLNGGKLKLGLGNATLYGGTAKGLIAVDGSGSGAGIATDLTLSAIDIDALMTAMSGTSKLRGVATVQLDVNGRGASQRAIVGSLGGKGAMRIKDGAIKGINIASFLRDAKKGFIFSEKSEESTDFTEMTATYTITQGVVKNEDLSMKSPVLRLAGKGNVSLPPRTIDYRLVPTLVSSLQGQGGKDGLSGVDIPLMITGPWSAISVTPDLAGALDSALKNPAALKENIKGIKDTIGDLNSPKDIGRALLGGGKKEAAPADGAAPAQPAPKTKEQQIQEGIGGLLGGFGK
jgi:AsmA protein